MLIGQANKYKIKPLCIEFVKNDIYLKGKIESTLVQNVYWQLTFVDHVIESRNTVKICRVRDHLAIGKTLMRFFMREKKVKAPACYQRYDFHSL